MRIVIAPNAFKHSLSATAAAEAIRSGLAASRLLPATVCCPVADGGDGTGDLLISHLNGEAIKGRFTDPLGRPIEASYGLLDNRKTAVIEMANASGLRLLSPDELDVMQASSYGTGQQIMAALDRGARKFFIAMGGSATVDGGIGMLHALGIRFLDSGGAVLPPVPASFERMFRIDASGLDTRVSASSFYVLCDVDNRLLGERGAAAMFGPQKGANATQVAQLDKGLEHFTRLVQFHYAKDIAGVTYSGTAGGASAGLFGCINAKLVHGIDFFLDLVGFDSLLTGADLVITGEGSIDEQTLQGKAPFGVASRAKKMSLPVVGLAGKIPLEPNAALGDWFDLLLAIGSGPTDLAAAFGQAAANLQRTAFSLGNFLHAYGAPPVRQ